MKFSAAIQGGAGSGEFTYSDFVMEGLKQGRIASMKASEAVFKFAQPAGVTKTITGSIRGFRRIRYRFQCHGRHLRSAEGQ